MLKSADGFTQGIIREKAIAAGLLGADQKEWVEAAALKPELRSVMVETSPAVFESLGIDPSSYPLAVCGAALVAYVGRVVSALRSLGKLVEAKVEADREKLRDAAN